MSGDPKRMLVTADLHFGAYPAGDACTLKLAEHVRESGADVFALAGDVANADPELFRSCLKLFADFKGLKLVVPGNHDLWAGGVGSQKKYRELLPTIASDCGFRMLDAGPTTVGKIGFIGNIGWYDYSFRNPGLNVSIDQYERKELPGVCTWNDSRYIDWELSDAEFTETCLRKLNADYRSIEPGVHSVVALLHHVPFRELLYGSSDTAHEFCRAYMGAERFGKLLLDFPKVRYVFCGHRHGRDTHAVNHIESFSVGSEYTVKRLLELDLSTGKHLTRVFAAEQDDEMGGPA